MASSSEAVQEQLKVLSGIYAQQLPDKIHQVRQLAYRVLRGERDGLAGLIQAAHSLAGSGATFGFVDLSDAARALEIYLKSMSDEPAQLTEAERDEIEAMVGALEHAAQAPSPAPVRASLSADISLAPGDDGGKDSGPDKAPEASTGVCQELVYLLEAAPHMGDKRQSGDKRGGRNLVGPLSAFGYGVRVFSTFADLLNTLTEEAPFALVMDIAFVGPEADAIAFSKVRRDAPFPVVYLSARDDYESRLRAVRAGGEAFLTLPVNSDRVLAALDEIAACHSAEPYRVLIVEDESAPASTHASILRGAGMEALAVTDPSEALRPLREFRPDLVLTDMYMTGCTGLELARSLCQVDGFADLAVVFLSAEADLDRQLAAAHWSAVDFLTKPVQPDHLVAAVLAAAQRQRVLRQLAARDQHTGVLGRRAFREQLGLALARAKRLNTGLALALVEVDGLNDIACAYGEPAAERATASLAGLLKRRVRRSDLIGRCASSRLAVVLHDTDARTAPAIANQIREAFARISQHVPQHVPAPVPDPGGSQHFSATCTVGVATYPEQRDAASMERAAVLALEQARLATRPPSHSSTPHSSTSNSITPHSGIESARD